MKLYHATPLSNLESIREYGLHSRYDGVYLATNPVGAARWVGIGKNEPIAVLEIEVKNLKALHIGQDHHPIMEALYNTRVYVSPKPKHIFTKVYIYEVNGDRGFCVETSVQEGFTARNRKDNPFDLEAEKRYEEAQKIAREYIETIEVFDNIQL